MVVEVSFTTGRVSGIEIKKPQCDFAGKTAHY